MQVGKAIPRNETIKETNFKDVKHVRARYCDYYTVAKVTYFFGFATIGKSVLTSLDTFLLNSIRLNLQKLWPYI